MDFLIGSVSGNPNTDHFASLIVNNTGDLFKSVRFLTHIHIKPDAMRKKPHNVDKSVQDVRDRNNAHHFIVVVHNRYATNLLFINNPGSRLNISIGVHGYWVLYHEVYHRQSGDYGRKKTLLHV